MSVPTRVTPASSELPDLPEPSGGRVARAVGALTGRQTTITRWLRRLVVAAVALVVLWLLFRVAVTVLTTGMFFDSLHDGSVYRTTLGAQVLLFVVFGGIAALVGGATMQAVRGLPSLPITQDDDTFRWMFRRVEPFVGRLLVVLAAVVPGVLVGRRAAAAWQTYLMWRHAAPFHTTDPLFHKDVSFFVAVWPFHQLVASLLVQTLTAALVIAVVAAYWYGAWRIRRGPRKTTRGLTALVSLLGAAWLAVHAAVIWLGRYALETTTSGPVTGAGWTDTHTRLPVVYVLTALSLLGAVALVANAFRRRRLRFLVGTVAVVAVAGTVLGSTLPGLVFHFREAPSAATLELPEIRHNQAATAAAFGLDGDVTTVRTTPSTAGGTSLVQQAGSTAQLSVIDPNQLSPTFNVEQQLQAYYGFKSTLDVGHYPLGGRSQDVVLAVRELRSSGIPKQSWVNNHLVYTHGYGVVAAPTTEVDPTTQDPVFLDAGMPPAQQIPVTRPQVYFGQGFGASSYAIVGQPAGSTTRLEFDHPAGGSTAAAHTTYQGHGGVPIGSLWRRLVYAVQLHDPNVLFSSEVNSASQLLTVRDPRSRVAKVAPWLTLDGDVYPAVVDGHIEWVVDGYTTASTYPDAQAVNLRGATNTSLNVNGASVQQASTSVNYMQNSVKAVVDAYTGRVTLYSWNQQQHPDPVLRTWESAFPGLVHPQSDIPSGLVPQLRYPTDLFNVQRSLLARYHVTDASNFYSGNDFWTVPTDPTTAASGSLNNGSAQGASAPLPSTYRAMSADGTGPQQYRLSSPMVTLNGQQLAAFVSVDAEPGPDYGRFTVLTFPSGHGGESPAQVQNDIESSTQITEALTLQRGGNSKVVLGELETVPVGGRILYVEPVYTRSSNGSSFPILRHVIALYGTGDPSFRTSLAPAVQDAVLSGAGTG